MTSSDSIAVAKTSGDTKRQWSRQSKFEIKRRYFHATCEFVVATKDVFADVFAATIAVGGASDTKTSRLFTRLLTGMVSYSGAPNMNVQWTTTVPI